MGADVDIAELARITEGYSGAEMVRICEKAFDAAIERRKRGGVGARDRAVMKDFSKAVEGTKRQITPEMVQAFERWARGE